MTTKQLSAVIGSFGLYHINGISVEVRVIDTKSSYGQVRLQIIPTAGTGTIWVQASSVTIYECQRAPRVVNYELQA